MRTLEQVYRVFDTLSCIVRNEPDVNTKFHALTSFVLFRSKTLLAALFKLKLHSQRFRGIDITFENYSHFFDLFDEIFLKKIYAFESSRKHPIIVDCGANIGLTSIFLKLAYPGSKILAFEPSPTAFRHLQHNLSMFSDVSAVCAAVSDKRGSVYITYPTNGSAGEPNSTLNTQRWAGADYVAEKAKSVLLSDYIADLPRIDLLKIDVEGSENAIIADLAKHNCLLKVDQAIVEFHAFKNNSLALLVNTFEKQGFRYTFSVGIRPPFALYKGKFWSILIHFYKSSQ